MATKVYPGFINVNRFCFNGVRAFSSHSSPLTLEKLSGKHEGISVIRLHKPDTKNAISKLLLSKFREAVSQLKFDKSARVLIIKSDVEGAFCTGADLKERRKMTVEEVPKFVDSIRSAMDEVSALPVPVIAAIDGFALGGGFELALACDIRVVSPKAKVGLVETKIAIIPAAGGSQRLPRLVGPALAKELIFTGRVLNGNEAFSLGLANHCVEDPYKKAKEIADEILRTGPIAIRVAKTAIDQGVETDLRTGLVIEQQCYAQVINTKDRLEGLAAFAEKRAPVFKGE
ncbi:unnamed protein product [Bursaphelenchus xylophilus]|uniref:(pine wood nematode) hypothetical protein n=1 Tax=Bursaphelenchus xylophilus TaxID=6326 RepID=A0A1I7RQU0_BURXY|nr:unnamed protein product [Bursaphelenchus xylophilus]CAG9113272.1 unnamed protein product [Bursaphelenchus xylophilus]